MLRNSATFKEVWGRLGSGSYASRALLAYVRFLERRFGASFSYDLSRMPFERADLGDVFAIAEKLKQRGVITEFGKARHHYDEPRISEWWARFGSGEEDTGGALSVDSDRMALTKALAEALERYLWFKEKDFFVREKRMTVAEALRTKGTLSPERFVGAPPTARGNESSVYTWIQAHSWTERRKVWIPAQIICSHPTLWYHGHTVDEPFIREPITTGLATHPDRVQALLSGALEVLERDAYMIMWLNQLTLPRIQARDLTRESLVLKELVQRTERYRLIPHFIPLLTDAPVHVMCVAVEDSTGNTPRFSLGIKAHASLAHAGEGALLEALRARRVTRHTEIPKQAPSAEGVGHLGRLDYWAHPTNAAHLEFLVKGPYEKAKKAPWETDSPREHFSRIVSWCKAKKYDLASVAFTPSKANVTPWHIEIVVIPQLQPIHFDEKHLHVQKHRIEDVPKQCGYTPRVQVFTERPHPFA